MRPMTTNSTKQRFHSRLCKQIMTFELLDAMTDDDINKLFDFVQNELKIPTRKRFLIKILLMLKSKLNDKSIDIIYSTIRTCPNTKTMNIFTIVKYHKFT